MKTDLYTKIVLTVIAACLLFLVLHEVSLTPTAHALLGTQDVRIVSILRPIGGFPKWDGLPIQADAELNVAIKKVGTLPIDGGTLPVTVR